MWILYPWDTLECSYACREYIRGSLTARTNNVLDGTGDGVNQNKVLVNYTGVGGGGRCVDKKALESQTANAEGCQSYAIKC